MAVDLAKGAEEGASHGSTWRDYAEDATGFGGVEWRTARDLMVRPRAVLDAYLMGGPTGGGRYARPTRFYLTMCGVLMFYLFLVRGNQRLLDGIPPGFIAALRAWSGQSPAAFDAGLDDWMPILTVPVLSLFYTATLAPLIKWWGGHRWRLAVRATLAMLCAATVPALLLGPLPYLDSYRALASIVVYAAIVLAFVRMGRGIWWHRPAAAVGKSVLVSLAIAIGAAAGMFAMLVLATVAIRLAG